MCIWPRKKAVLTTSRKASKSGSSGPGRRTRRPILRPDLVADALGANLFFTRLKGHGRGGLAMAEPVAGDWLEDTAEALAIGQKLGERVVVVSTSTGGTVAAIAATDPALMERVAGIIFVSPNFRVKNPTATILEWPLARTWSTLIAGAERSFAPALIPMSAAVKFARDADYSGVDTPALFLFSDDDAVVDAETTRAVSTKWGGPVTLQPRVMGEGDDPFNHVIAGDILSPGQTDETAQIMTNWIKELP